MARASGLNTGLTIRYLKQGDNLNDDSIVNNFDGLSATDSSDLAPNWSWWTAGNGLIRNFEQNFLARDFAFALKHFKANEAAASDIGVITTTIGSAAVPVPASSPLHYYLKIDGVTGDVTAKGFEGWFSVDAYDLGVQNTGSIGSAGGGAGAGKAQFSPLTVDIHSLAGLAPLLHDVASGQALKSVELAGVRTVKDKSTTVYDIKLSEVLVSSFENDPGPRGVETELAFNFNKISVTDQPLSANGRPGTPETFSFDLRENKTDAAVAVSDLAVSATATSIASDPVAVPASSPLHYYLKIDGLKGDVTAQGFEGWFAVDGYDIGIQNTGSIGSASGGAGVGKAQFSPLTVDIHSLAGLASLFGDVASGHALKSVELAGVRTIKDKSTTVYDVKLSEVFVSSFENDPGTLGVETQLALNFNKISVTDQPLSANGRPGTPETFSFDLRENKTDAAVAVSDLAVSAAAASIASDPVAVPASSPLHYYLKIDGLKGDVTAQGFEGWFAVDGYDIGVQNTGSIGSAGGGAGAGKAQFSPLTVDIHSLAGLASLFGDVASGHVLKSAELAGVSTIKDKSTTVYDLKLSEVLVSSFKNDPGTQGVETELALNFNKISVTDQPPSANGRPGTPETFSFDLRENKTDAAVAVSDLAVSAAATSIASDPVAVPASSPLHYYLKIDGLKGDVTAQGFEGWFSVDGYDLGIQNTGSIGSASGGAGVGKAQFSPLTVDIHSLAGLASLFGDVASGHALKSVELAGVRTIKDKSTTVYDVKLSEVFVSSFKNDPGSQGVETELALNFGKISVTDQPLSANGQPGTPETFSFDLRENKTDAAVAASDLAVSTAAASIASDPVAVPASSPLQYYLKIDGLKGDVTAQGFEGWFAVDGYDIGVQNTGSIGSAGGGAGVGKAQFSPLTVDIHSLAGLASLFGDVASGHALKSAELAGVRTIKDKSTTVYDIKLSEVFVSSFENDPGTHGVETQLALNFNKISVTDQPQSTNGQLGTPETFSFDLRENKTDAAVAASDLAVSAAATSIASSPVAVPASSPLHYYLKIDGLKGDVTAQGFEGWFAVDGYDIGVQNTGSIGSAGGGAGVGKAQFSPLTVDIHSLAGLASLFGDVASGHALKSVELAGVANVKDKSTTVYDLKLSEVLVSSFKNDPGSQGVETELAFNFGRISLTDQPLSANGRLGTAQTFAFDLGQNKADAAVAGSDTAVDAQLNNMALALASFMASSTLGSAGAEDLASTSPPQDNHLTTLAAAHG